MKKRKYLYRKPDPRNPDLVRIYFRHPVTKALTALPADEGSKEFASQYAALLCGVMATPKSSPPPKPRDPNGKRVKRNRDDGGVVYRPATLGWFVEQYLASEFFHDTHKDRYADGTQYNYRKHLAVLKARLGRGVLADLDQESVEVHSAEVARVHGNSAADDQIAMVSNLWQFAAQKFPDVFKRKGKMNPTYRINRHYQHDGEGHLAWSDDVLEAFDQDCPANLQFVRMGLHYTGQRGGDVVRMKWADFDGKRIFVVQEKTGKKLWLNCPKPLLIALKREQAKTNRAHIFHHAYDGPFSSAQTLSHAIRNRLEKLGINKNEPGVKGYTMHGLRKNAGIELALAGCSVSEIMAVLGHKTEKMALFYVAQAMQDELNVNAVDKWDALIEKKAAIRASQRRDSIRVVA